MKNILIFIISFIVGIIIFKINTPYYILNLFLVFTAFIIGTILIAGICMTDKKPKGE